MLARLDGVERQRRHALRDAINLDLCTGRIGTDIEPACRAAPGSPINSTYWETSVPASIVSGKDREPASASNLERVRADGKRQLQRRLSPKHAVDHDFCSAWTRIELREAHCRRCDVPDGRHGQDRRRRSFQGQERQAQDARDDHHGQRNTEAPAPASSSRGCLRSRGSSLSAANASSASWLPRIS